MKQKLIFFFLIFSLILFGKESYDVVIAGGGPAGLTAAIYSARSGLSTLIIERSLAGGQISLTEKVENFPGFEEGINGFELGEIMKAQALKSGAFFQEGEIVDVDLSNRPFKLILKDGSYKIAHALILATGSSPRLLNLESEAFFFGRGVSTCAVCDAPLFRNKKVIVVGGGDSAFEEALFLSRYASQVVIIHRRDSFRASKILQKRVKNAPNIHIICNSTVQEILSIDKDRVEGVMIQDTVTYQKEQVPCDGVFIAIGQVCNTEWLKGKVDLGPFGHITSTPEGVFVAGDVSDPFYRQAITAAGSGCIAAINAYQYLQNKE